MKSIKTTLVLAFLVITNYSLAFAADDLLPSEVYYNENIAVNIVGADAPTLGSTDDEGLDPGGNGWGGGGFVGSPVGDAVLPLFAAVMVYGSVILYRRRNSVSKN